MAHENVIEMHEITKIFGEFVANDKINLELRKGEIHALLGENGDGKSTLMNMLAGLLEPTSGEIAVNGQVVNLDSPSKAASLGIGMVHQHFMLVENFTVTENIVLGNEVTKAGGVLDPKRAREKVLEIVEEYGFDVDPDAKIEDISVGMQQRVEILKALYRGADTLILDEPTAVLTPQEIEKLIQIMHDLVSKGKTIIVITHKLKEIMSSADECTIIRRGKYMSTVDVSKTSETELATLMVGRNVNLHVEKKPATPGEVVLSIKDLHVKDERGIEQVNGFNLDIRAGEIVGLAGIDGNGQKELADAINALVKPESGTISVKGEEIQGTTPKTVIDHAVATIPSDRHRWGLVLPFTVAENMVLERHNEETFGKGIALDLAKIKEFSQKLIDEFDIRPAECAEHQAVGLSGGNQQKVIIAREVSSNPDVLIAIQPTRGLDVGAIEFVHKALILERYRGAAILLISFELDEIMDVADKMAIIYAGKNVGEFDQGTITEEQAGLLMAGGDAE